MIRNALIRIAAQRDASLQASRDASLSTYQQDLAAARCWAFGEAVRILEEVVRGARTVELGHMDATVTKATYS